jgi:phosphoserine/homoserine phosphotransferase
MLRVADKAILFRPPENVKAEFPQFPVTTSYAEVKREIKKIITR